MSAYDNFNPEQKAAVDADNGVIVSASAGSGKTSVLVERVMRKIETETSVDNLLIVTFTNNAAAEMRRRIEQAISEKLAQNPKDKNMAKQKSKLAGAHICTIDSFCLDIVREYYDELGVMPDFTPLEGTALKLLQDKAIEDCFAKAYEEKDGRLFNLIYATSTSNNEADLAGIIKSVHEDVTNFPFYADWLKKWRDYYENTDTFEGSVWQKSFIELGISRVERVKNSAHRLLENGVFSRDEYAVFAEKAKRIAENCEKLISAAQNGSTGALIDALKNAERFDNRKGASSEVKDIFGALSGRYKAALGALGDLLCKTENTADERYSQTARYCVDLIDFVLEYDKHLWDCMEKANALTFWASEQLALKLLCRMEEGKIVPTGLGREVAENYAEVMVDEYQDTNEMQDALFTAISGGGKRLFAVGDAKQSIYSFRGANPGNFTSKIKGDSGVKLNKILLNKNYRSHKSICDYVNGVFADLMTEEDTGIEYRNEKLESNNKDTDNRVSVNVFIPNDNAKTKENAVCEAVAVANYIRRMMQDRPELEYSDFSVLLRTNTAVDGMAENLINCGIPAAKQKAEFLTQKEISLALCLISAVDNPSGDVEMLAVLLSPLFGVTADEIALLRSKYKANSIWGSVCLAKDNEKFCRIAEKLSEYRNLSVMLSLPDYLGCLFDECGLIYIARAMQNGKARAENLYLLQQMAADYKAAVGGTVKDFAEYVKSREDKRDVNANNDNCVNVTSIHKSKGLQYKVCIVAGLNGASHGRNKKAASVDYTLGIGLDIKGKTKNLDVNSPVTDVILAKNRAADYASEMRLMYVAMTRAQEHLALFFHSQNIGEEAKAINMDLFVDGKISAETGAKKPCYWLMASALFGNTASVEQFDTIASGGAAMIGGAKYTVQTAPEMPEYAPEAEVEIDTDEVERQLQALKTNLLYEYPFSAACEEPSKRSVSELTHTIVKDYDYTEKPGFLSKSGLTPAGRGTATHTFMQFADLKAAAQNVSAELERLREYRYLTDEQAGAVDVKKIEKFFASDIYRRMEKALAIHREMRFLVKEKPQAEDSPVLQGVADCVIEEPDGLTIIDFKTDRVQSGEQLLEMYKEQLRLYKTAATRILNKPVKQCLLYSFHLGCEVEAD